MICLCPHCGARLDTVGSIKVPVRGHERCRINASGRLEQSESVIEKRGSYKCVECGRRLSRFIKEVQVGMVKGGAT